MVCGPHACEESAINQRNWGLSCRARGLCYGFAVTDIRQQNYFDARPTATARLLFCFLLIPSFFALLNVLRGSVFNPGLSFFDRVLIFLPCALVGWAVAGIIIAGIVELTHARSLPATIAATVVGVFLMTVFNYYALSEYFYLMLDRWPWLSDLLQKRTPQFTPSLSTFLVGPSALYGYATLAIAHAGYRILIPGSRYLGDSAWPADVRAHRAKTSPDPDMPGDQKTSVQGPVADSARALRAGFMTRLPPALGRDLILLSAEEHYMRVVTRLGSDIVLYRLSDAIEDLAGYDGDQVHRSYWVAWNEVAKIQKDGRSFRLLMTSGEVVPVSRSYSGLVASRLRARSEVRRNETRDHAEPAVSSSAPL